MRTKIYAIVGPSGSGKSTLVRFLEEELDIPQLVSHTTRPMRSGEEQGREHWFDEDICVPAREKMLAYALFGGFHYWVALSQLDEYDVCTYIIDEDALVEMIEKFGDRYDIVPIYVDREYDPAIGANRIERDNKRTILPRDFYKAIIVNNGTLEEFFYEAAKIFNSLND